MVNVRICDADRKLIGKFENVEDDPEIYITLAGIAMATEDPKKEKEFWIRVESAETGSGCWIFVSKDRKRG